MSSNAIKTFNTYTIKDIGIGTYFLPALSLLTFLVTAITRNRPDSFLKFLCHKWYLKVILK
jgi:hypothetical protein